MLPDDVGELTEVSDPRLSPDATTAAFVVTRADLEVNSYASRIWMAAVDAATPPRPFTAGEHRDARPRWSPDGSRLAFVSHRDDRGSELYLLPVGAGGELVRIASWPEEIEELEWSPDGTRLAFTARRRDEERYRPERDRDRPARRIDRVVYRLDNVGWTADRPRHLFVVPADGGRAPVPLTDGDFDHAGIAWSPDGTTVAFAAGRHATWDRDSFVDLWTVAATGGEPRRLTDTSKAYGRPSFSPDGTALAFTCSDPTRYPGHGQVGVLSMTAITPGEPRVLTADLDRQCTPFLRGAREPVWDGDRVLFLVEDQGNTHLYAVGVHDDKPQPVIAGDREVSGFDAGGGTIVFCASSPVELSELHVVRNRREERVTAGGAALLQRCEVVAPERFTATAPDGAEVEAWVMRPVGAQPGERYPTLLNVHGGPFTQYGNRFFDEFQVQVAAGYAVIYANPRGSSGYSNAWAQAICGPASFAPGTGWGGADYDDLMAVCDTAIAEFDFVDADRMGVLGGSYGGFMTSWIIGHTDRFKAACSERAVNNHLSFCGTSDIGVRFPKCYFGPNHLDDPDLYLRQSPISYVRDIDTPVLILHADGDLRCPVEQAEQLFVALKLLEQDVTFVRFPGEGHELSRTGAPRHRIERLQIILDWFARRL